jgi:hypothetical protein
MNSISGVRRARLRDSAAIGILEAAANGGNARGWDDVAGETFLMRWVKHDMYFPIPIFK